MKKMGRNHSPFATCLKEEEKNLLFFHFITIFELNDRTKLHCFCMKYDWLGNWTPIDGISHRMIISYSLLWLLSFDCLKREINFSYILPQPFFCRSMHNVSHTNTSNYIPVEQIEQQNGAHRTKCEAVWRVKRAHFKSGAIDTQSFICQWCQRVTANSQQTDWVLKQPRR